MLLAMPLTILIVILFEQFEETRWLAVLMSTSAPPQSDAATDVEPSESPQPETDDS